MRNLSLAGALALLGILLPAAPAGAAPARANLVLTMTADPASVPAPGGGTTLTVDLRNDGSRAAQSAVVRFALPAGAEFATDGATVPAGWTCDLPAATCGHTPLAAATVAPTLRLPLVLPAGTAGDTGTVTATVSGGPESSTADNSARAVIGYVAGVADLAVDPAGTAQELLPGEQARLTTTVRNSGNVVSGDLTVVAAVPAGMTGAEPWSDGWECTSGDGATDGSAGWRCSHAPLLPGQVSEPVTFAATLTGLAPGDSSALTATVSTTVPETTLANNTARTSVAVIAGAVVRGTVWFDANYNGVRDAGESGPPTGIEAVTVLPETAGEPGYAATVEADGTYRAYVRAGAYRVEFQVRNPYEFIDSPDSDLADHWNDTGGWTNLGHTAWFTVATGGEVVLDAGVN
ncbi:hypothetical protein GCM10023107_73240 [Actinoplanes octamycinicus]